MTKSIEENNLKTNNKSLIVKPVQIRLVDLKNLISIDATSTKPFKFNDSSLASLKEKETNFFTKTTSIRSRINAKKSFS